MLSVSIALATCNGEKHLDAQLRSLAAQTRLPSELVVCDDCSDDRTPAIIGDFAKRAPFAVHLHENPSRIGYRANFMQAAQLCRGDLIAFCDQDDIWEPDKLVAMARLFDDPQVQLAYHNATVVTADGAAIGALFKTGAKPDRIEPLTMPPWILVAGFTQVFRRDLVRFSRLQPASVDAYWPDQSLAHDQWFLFLASVFGRIVRLAAPLARYRQHGGNAFGWPGKKWILDIPRWILQTEFLVMAAAELASTRAAILREITDEVTGDDRQRAQAGVAYYEALHERISSRIPIYASRSVIARARSLYVLLRRGAYGRLHGSARFTVIDLLLDAYAGVPCGPMMKRFARPLGTLRLGRGRHKRKPAPMAIELLGEAFLALTLICVAILCLIIVPLVYLLYLHLKLRPAGLALEMRRLAQPLPPDDMLPHVVVQIPSFNEGRIVERGIAAAAELDWPKDKLHIQICDDSTDDTTEIARKAAQRAAASGVNVAVLHREHRRDFKAGALNEGRAQSEHAFFAVLDVDYVPSREFLRRCMTVLLAETKLGFVQARVGFLNADENLLTRGQAILLDAHYAFEQTTRSWANYFLPFNGTCGVWRGAAIEAAGGWSGDTLTEDWDLSYRAWERGWRGTILTSVTVSGELPRSLPVWIEQQKRWSTGIGQVACKVLPRIMRDRSLSRQERLAALIPLGTWFGFMMFGATLLPAIAAAILNPSIGWDLAAAVYAVYLAATAVIFAIAWVTRQFTRPGTRFLRFALDYVVVVPWLLLYMAWANFRALPAMLLRRPQVFVRTPKQGVPTHLHRKGAGRCSTVEFYCVSVVPLIEIVAHQRLEHRIDPGDVGREIGISFAASREIERGQKANHELGAVIATLTVDRNHLGRGENGEPCRKREIAPATQGAAEGRRIHVIGDDVVDKDQHCVVLKQRPQCGARTRAALGDELGAIAAAKSAHEPMFEAVPWHLVGAGTGEAVGDQNATDDLPIGKMDGDKDDALACGSRGFGVLKSFDLYAAAPTQPIQHGEFGQGSADLAPLPLHRGSDDGWFRFLWPQPNPGLPRQSVLVRKAQRAEYAGRRCAEGGAGVDWDMAQAVMQTEIEHAHGGVAHPIPPSAPPLCGFAPNQPA